jgi:general secretion pathway protein D
MKIGSSPLAVVLAVLLSGPVALAQNALTTPNPAPTPQLKPTSNAPITLHMTDDSKNIYQAIGKLAGINVLFDPDYTSKHVQLDLTSASLTDALRIVGDITNSFYKPITSNTIFVAFNSRQKHVDLDDLETRTFYLKNASQQADANEVVTALRNVLPAEAKVYLVASQDAIVMRTTPDWLTLAQKLLNDLDLPRKTYRLNYTVTELDGAKILARQNFAMLAISGQQTVFKQGSKVPIATGAYNTASTENKAAGVQTQYTYIDVGMNFDSTLTSMGDSAILKANVDRSAVAPETSGVGAQDPIVNQTELSGVFLLTPGKPAKIGSLDMPGTSHRLDIEATIERLP